MDTAITDCRHNYEFNRIVMFPITNVLDTAIKSNCLSQILGNLRSTHTLYKWELTRTLHRASGTPPPGFARVQNCVQNCVQKSGSASPEYPLVSFDVFGKFSKSVLDDLHIVQ